ncbi:ATP-binding protein [Nodosilinea sp. LEGE 07298]|uniref:AAA family ATPase n=1 Tax=Nodosilinea sp. LEGE 07298 TaxID=2777970 RepID=UPI001881B79D|nr:AAA family ATPase [Nodosilinea sp. LEGE 07298]MBE9113052.1 ATP-binding protein [Nodosilinea sp. LEGE 07298]
MPSDFEILRSIYNAFDPFEPLHPGDPVYVNCSAVRGEENILVDVGRQITLSDRITHQLYTGHRGAGKSTELLRLKDALEKDGYRVVYFAAEEDIDFADARYPDILLACTHNLIKSLDGNQDSIRNWLQSRRTDFHDVVEGALSFGNFDAEVPFSKLTLTLKASPEARAKIRRVVESYAPSLIEALNTFITEAMAQTPQHSTDKLVLIVDSLDHISPTFQENEISNHEQIFVDRSEQLKLLNCHVIYTVPISLVYSGRAPDLRDIYDAEIQVLPMVMVHDQEGNVCEDGLNTMRELVRQRVFHASAISDEAQLVNDIFDQAETLDQLCLMSGGHMRNLMLMAQEAIAQTSALPISKKAVRLAITKARNTYRNAVYDDQWGLLANVWQTKGILNDEAHRELLFNRCILEYRYLDDDGEIFCWRDVNPLLRGVKEFGSPGMSMLK